MTFRLSTRGLTPVGAVALAILLAACGGRTAGTIPPTGSDATQPLARSQTFAHHQTFRFTGKPQRFKVPHVQWLQVDLRGASGEATATGNVAHGGRVFAQIPAALDHVLVVYVGGAGSGAKGGFNGGGAGAPSGSYCNSDCIGYGGGGASDIRLSPGTLGDRVLVAGGGGGGGGGTGGAGGSGGGVTAASGSHGTGTSSGSDQCAGSGGGGGTQTAGGAGGNGAGCVQYGGGFSGNAGSVGNGGLGGEGMFAGGGGGGGGGFYGGGGGGGGIGTLSYGTGGGGGGGGGPSFVGKRARHAYSWRGWKSSVGNGLVVISW